MPATSGNLSLRLDDESCVITASGRDKGRLSLGDVLRVPFASVRTAVRRAERHVERGARGARRELAPSAETLLHTSLYARYPDVGAVFHTHSRAATLLSMLAPGQAELTLVGYELSKALRGVGDTPAPICVPVLENHADLERLANEALAVLDQRARTPCQGYVIRGHGLYAWGATWGEAWRHLEALEYLLGCELELCRLGRHAALEGFA